MNPPRMLVTILYAVVYLVALRVCYDAFLNGYDAAGYQMLAVASALLVAISREYRHKACVLLMTPTDVLHERCARVAPDAAPADDREQPAAHGDS